MSNSRDLADFIANLTATTTEVNYVDGVTSAVQTQIDGKFDDDSNLSSFVSAFTLPTSDGSADQILKTNGSGTLSFTTVSSGGLIHISTINASSASTATFSGLDSTYDRYIIKGDNLEFSTNNSQLRARFNGSGSQTKYVSYGLKVGDTSIFKVEASSNYVELIRNISNDTDNIVCFSLETGSVNNSGHQNFASTTVCSVDEGADAGVRRQDSAGSFTGSVGTLTSLQFYPSSGTFTGKFRLYGVSKAND